MLIQSSLERSDCSAYVVAMLFIAHMWGPPFCLGRSNAVFMLFYHSHVSTAILNVSQQCSVCVVAMFRYYHSHNICI